jgi:NAD(P)-dependent dehydrogenase (short-subunit alcohol dehydrogenase family)
VATIAITGSAGGIGAATRERLEQDGHTVVGVDIRDADVEVDLSTPEGRAAMVEGVTAATDGVLDGLVAAAGLLGGDGPTVVSVNHFGAVATLEGLRPLLERGTSPSAVAISSNSTTTFPDLPTELAERCQAGDEDGARAAAAGVDPVAVYPATKLALARWVRRAAVSEAWVGEGIRLNAVAPGFIATPMTAGTDDFVLELGDVYPVPQRRPGQAVEVAGLLAYLLSPEAAFFCGSVVFMDGGTDAALRPDRPDPKP